MLEQMANAIDSVDLAAFDSAASDFDSIDGKIDTNKERWEQEMKGRIRKHIQKMAEAGPDLTGVRTNPTMFVCSCAVASETPVACCVGCAVPKSA